MKLTKQKLIRLTESRLSALGYKYVLDSVTAAQGLYLKRTSKSLFLTLGLTISRYYDNMFTASYYLSHVTSWGSLWGDIPIESYKRVGHFLTQVERERWLSREQTNPHVRDAWWDANDTDSLEHFFNAVSVTESRFLSQPNLSNNIEKSVDVKEMKETTDRTILILEASSYRDASAEFSPLKPVDNIPLEWFKSAEQAIKELGGILNSNTVKRVAADAYRQRMLVR